MLIKGAVQTWFLFFTALILGFGLLYALNMGNVTVGWFLVTSYVWKLWWPSILPFFLTYYFPGDRWIRI
ncbi:MAG: hypothetical protein ACI9H6_000136 [Patiriisocius sp.]|jgi:hypothetical protein